MKKQDILSAIAIGAGLSLIFGYASHNWAGIICGVLYVIGYIIANKNNAKKNK